MSPAEAILKTSEQLLRALYPSRSLPEIQKRYQSALSRFAALFGKDRDIILVSAPGRTEIGGNHTDHQQGNVLAAAVDLDILCIASPRTDRQVNLHSEGFDPDILDLSELAAKPGERGSQALIRGVAAWLDAHGYQIGGFDAYTVSEVLTGSGLSSSAAFEVAVGQTFNHLCNGGRISPTELAMAGQFAENVYLGKPSGLMDQMASSVGGFVQIDFRDPQAPRVTPLQYRLEAYALCIVDSGGSHADLTPDYAAIPAEMRLVAEALGKSVLGEAEEESFRRQIPALRERCGDRAVLRALHFFSDDRRAVAEARALQAGDFPAFLALVNESGLSSVSCLQNIYARPEEQGISLALALAHRLLDKEGGVCRVHGGGFAGTIQAFVPERLLTLFQEQMTEVFGRDSCYVLRVRPYGGLCLNRTETP